MTPRLCPVCWQGVTATPVAHQVHVHLDKAGAKCPMSGHNFWLCYPAANDPKLRGAA
ncbi:MULTISPECIES: hypothetical protein [Mycolicibacterium]|uniref:Uncharacterized protein n=1 Tax=Mycobacterium phage Bipper TaxID=1805457 RepID=A0A142F2I9_9CAUD|nr:MULTISPECIES: hypothetical protein [Mycolicibacterium]YP_009303208.1 hypothetical protein KCH39_gp116 [Mycobacterium phage Bipper]QDF19347.1 hypothetical protein SEA_CRACKLEWINK_61 [Mycobacterium phage Cracklewink]AMQ66996.1 hypothetical protein SEA_BIPPER_61 [Mycobacterium phage Bipper]MCC9181163.1 hypothetical protein [Mycolicibacterium mageritense]UBV14864.1 hypothetical protein H8Z57_29940 [Mycolicibacterium fortuitum]